MRWSPPVRPACYIPDGIVPGEITPADIARRYRLRRAWGTAAELAALALFYAFILLMAARDGAA